MFKKCHIDSRSGKIDAILLSLIVLSLLTVGLSVFSGWSFYNYLEYKNNSDTKVSEAVAIAKKDQADSDEAKFMERDKQPLRQFVGPDDYGRVTFDYPKTWSVYVADDATDGSAFYAYLNPVSVPAISEKQQFALRVSIETKDYDSYISSYSSMIKKGQLKSSSISIGDINGTRLDGLFSNNIRGSMVVYKIRDKILVIKTDAETFKSDFDNIISTIKFNQ